jgi:DNA repair protein RadA/Sms
VAAGEVGLTGNLRSIPNADKIIQEASRLGYDAVILPEKNAKQSQSAGNSIQILGAATLADAIKYYLR